MSDAGKKQLTDIEGSAFWRTHFGIPAKVPFPLLFDMVSEEFRSKPLAVLSLSCFSLFFYYLAIFNKPSSKLSCLEPVHAYEEYLDIDAPFFKGTYAVLGLWGLVGNISRYRGWVRVGTALWIAWTVGCLTYNLQSCAFGKELESGSSVKFYHFLGFSAAHYALVVAFFLGGSKASERHSLALSHPGSFPTPVRVYTAVLLSLWIVLTLLISVHSKQTLQTVVQLFKLIHDLNHQHFEENSISALGRSIIKPLPYALLTGALVATTVCLASICSLYRNYRRIMMHVLRKQGHCKWLGKAWKVGTHNGMFLNVQFVANSVYLYLLLTYFLATVTFFLYSSWFYIVIWDYLKLRPIWFPLAFLAFLGKWLYLPRLMQADTNRIRNQDYFNFWSLVYSLFGVLMALLRSSWRFIAGVGFMLGFGYRADVSVFPEGMEGLDSLYTAFCGMVVIHCLEAGVTPYRPPQEASISIIA